jgi:hypothetical protein
MHEIINEAEIIDNVNSFINSIETCIPDDMGSYIVTIITSQAIAKDIDILLNANLIIKSSDSEEKKFTLGTFELLKRGYKFYLSFDEFLEQNTYELRNAIGRQEIIHHYIYEEKIIVQKIDECNENSTSLLNNLFTVYILNDILKITSDDSLQKSSNLKEYVFFEKKKITVSSEVNSIKIKTLTKAKLSVIFDLFKELKNIESNDQKIRLVFFKSALEKVCDAAKNVNINFIIDNLEKIANEYHSYYRAYLNSLDPTKLRIDFEKGSQEFIGKLSNSLSDIYGKIILIPIASLAAFYQITREHPIRNFILAILIVFITFAIIRFSDTQKLIVDQIKKNIRDFQNLYALEAKDYITFSNQIEEKSEAMLMLCDDVINKIKLSRQLSILCASLITISALWIWFNHNIYDLLISLKNTYLLFYCKLFN